MSKSLHPFWQLIEARYGGLSKQLQRAAKYMREHPQQVALSSLRSVAADAGVSPTTMTRLMQKLGFDNWADLQLLHQKWLTEGQGGVFSGPADRVITDAGRPGAEDQLLDRMADSDEFNLRTALDRDARELLRQAADLLALAPMIAVAGLRSSFPVAFGLHYALSLFMSGSRLMPGTGGVLLDGLHHLRPGAVLVAISISPYSRETVELARLAHHGGCRVVALTDGPLSPVAQIADVTLTARTDSPSHLASVIGLMGLAQALAMLVLARGGEDALQAMRHRETILETTSAYLMPKAEI